MKNDVLFFPWQTRTQSTIFSNGDSQNTKQIANSGLDKDGIDTDSNLLSLVVNQLDTVDNIISLFFTDGTGLYPFFQCALPAVNPTTGKWNTYNILYLLTQQNLIVKDSFGNGFIHIPKGWRLLASLQLPCSVQGTITTIATLEDF